MKRMNAQSAMRVIEVTKPGIDAEARWVKKGDKSLFGYKQHTVADNMAWY
jgi:IS5 family transposase